MATGIRPAVGSIIGEVMAGALPAALITVAVRLAAGAR